MIFLSKLRTVGRYAGSGRWGFTLVEIMIVVALIGSLASLAMVNFVRARNRVQVTTCIENLRQISYSKHQWALENRRSDADTPTWADLGTYLRGQAFSNCPAGGVYTINPAKTEPACSVVNHLVPTP